VAESNLQTVPQSIYHIAQIPNLIITNHSEILPYKLTIGICGSHYINTSLCGYFFVILYLRLTFISFLMFVTGWPQPSPPLLLSFHFTVTQIFIRFSSFFEFSLAVLWALPIVNIFFHYFPLVFTRLLHSLATYLFLCLCLSLFVLDLVVHWAKRFRYLQVKGMALVM